MYKRILIATISDTSELALREAVGLAKDENTILRLVHVVDVTPPAYMATEISAPLAAQIFACLIIKGYCRRRKKNYSEIARYCAWGRSRFRYKIDYSRYAWGTHLWGN
jgi:hypothetical protein